MLLRKKPKVFRSDREIARWVGYDYKPGDVFLGYGLSLQREGLDRWKPVFVFVPRNLAVAHGLIHGMTRHGKSRLLERLAYNDILEGLSVVVIDPKGDSGLLETNLSACIKANRLKDFVFFSPIYPERSLRFNPLYGLTPDEIVDVVIAGLPQGKDEFFMKIAEETTRAIVYSHFALGNEEIRFVDIFSNIPQEKLKKIQEEVETKISEAVKEREDAQLLMQEIANSPRDYYSKVVSTLRTSVSSICVGPIGELVGKARGNPIYKRLMDGEPLVLHAYLGSLNSKARAYMLSRFLLSTMVIYAGKYNAANKKFNPMLRVHADEASNVFFYGIEDLINKVGGTNFSCWFYTQSFNDIVARVGPHVAGMMFDNTHTKVVFKVDDAATVKRLEGIVPKVEKPRYFLRDGLDLMGGGKEPLIEAAEFGQLPVGVCFAYTEGKWYRLYNPVLIEDTSEAVKGVEEFARQNGKDPSGYIVEVRPPVKVENLYKTV
jgi:hypothetical protein